MHDTGPFAGYSNESRPLGSYAVVAGLFSAAFGGLAVNAARTGRLPERVEPSDVIALGIATHKLSRLISRSTIASFLRAPFTKLEGHGGLSELNESPRGGAFRHAVGELLGCPVCVDQWVASGFVAGLLYAPRTTRVVAAMFGVVAMADLLQLAYASAQARSE